MSLLFIAISYGSLKVNCWECSLLPGCLYIQMFCPPSCHICFACYVSCNKSNNLAAVWVQFALQSAPDRDQYLHLLTLAVQWQFHLRTSHLIDMHEDMRMQSSEFKMCLSLVCLNCIVNMKPIIKCIVLNGQHCPMMEIINSANHCPWPHHHHISSIHICQFSLSGDTEPRA